MKKLSITLILVNLWLLSTGCVGLLEPTPGPELGVIAMTGEPAVIEAPDTVEVGESFAVSILTYGGGCISMDRTEASAAGLSAEVRPYDVHSGAELCTGDVRMVEHAAVLTFGEAGNAEIRFYGREMPADSVIVVVRSVVVEQPAE